MRRRTRLEGLCRRLREPHVPPLARVDVCWTDGTNSTCGGTRYDVETVALNEMGHVNRLGHHVNPDYADAVVQAVPYPFGSATGFGTNRALRWADHQALHALYGTETRPCPQAVDP